MSRITSENLSEYLALYAHLIANDWANIQAGQRVLITGEETHRELIENISEACKGRKAGQIEIHWKSTETNLHRLRTETIEALQQPNPELMRMCKDLVDNDGSLISISDANDPSVFADIDPERIQALEGAADKARLDLRKRGLGENRITRCLAAAANTSWAKMVFPDIDPEVGVYMLWDAIFDSCVMFAPNPKRAFREVEDQLQRSRDFLQENELRQLRFVGPGTDLIVGLTSEAVWLSGEKSNRNGIKYFANVPIGEIFTTPDYRATVGTVRITMPTIIDELLVTGISLTFKDGELVAASAETNEAALTAMIETDEGANRLGEIALVGGDAPLSHSSLLFHQTLLDEKGRSHLALGSAYRNCIRNGATLSKEEAFILGINDSIVHHDLMIGDQNTDVFGIGKNGPIPIMRKGKWAFSK